MLYRIFVHDRWLSVNLPDNSYSDAELEALRDRLVAKLSGTFGFGPANWAELQAVELEAAEDGWQGILYYFGRSDTLSFTL